MKKKQKIKILGLFFLIFISTIIIQNHLQDDQVEKKEQKEKPSTILCSSIELKKITPVVTFSGKIRSSNKINIISEVNGVSEIYNSKFEVGEKFQKGEVLISIRDEDIELELKSIKSQFLALLVQVLPNIKMDFPSLGEAFELYINNFSLNGKIADLPKTTTSKQRNFLSKQILVNYYQIKSLENKLDKFKIRAPFSGVVTKAFIDVGSNIIIGQPIGEFINPNSYEIQTSVSVKDSKLFQTGNKALIYSDDLNDEIEGVVKRVGNHVNAQSQSIDVFISIKGNEVKDGMYSSGKIICDTINNAYAVDRSKIIDTNKIYLLEDKKIDLKQIEIIAFQDDSVIIKGIEDNDCIVNQYRHYLYDGMPVN